MSQVEAGACARPVIGIRAMGMLDTLIPDETAYLANVAQTVVLREVEVGVESGYSNKRRITFDPPRVAEYRASVDDLAEYLLSLMRDANLREDMGNALRAHVVKNFDYRVVARRFVEVVARKLGIH